MKDVTDDTLQIAYLGPALDGGQMSMLALGSSLRGQALLIRRIKDILYGESVQVRVEVDYQFERGSLVVPVHIISDAVLAGEPMLTGPAVSALVNLIAIAGFASGAGLSLYKLFKMLKGRKLEKLEQIPRPLTIEELVRLFILVYNDPEVQKQLRRTLEALRQDGVEEFQTRRRGEVIDRVTKKDLMEADEAEIDDITKDEEIELDIEKSAWRPDLAWHFSDGKISFDARIEDKAFWERIAAGEAFAGGDRLRVHLQTTARRNSFGRLKVERVIPGVIDVEHVRNSQQKLFEGESSE